MKPKESPKRQTTIDYSPDSVTLAPDHVNRAKRSRANKVMDQSPYWELIEANIHQ